MPRGAGGSGQIGGLGHLAGSEHIRSSGRLRRKIDDITHDLAVVIEPQKVEQRRRRYRCSAGIALLAQLGAALHEIGVAVVKHPIDDVFLGSSFKCNT
jgi:predicted polyphosphate/ATP-dependent NAD kinase